MIPTFFGGRDLRCARSISDNTNGITFFRKSSITARLTKLDLGRTVRYHAHVTKG